jgi:hypothetical protein
MFAEPLAMYCVYCNENHDPAEKFSDEHIIPEALGGPRSFAIRTCEKINNTLGHEVDDPFMKMFPVNSDRFFGNLQSHRGMPTIDLSGTTILDGKETPIQSTFKDGQKVLKISNPSVEITPEADRDLWKVSGDPQQVKLILLGKLKAVTEKGKTMTHPDGTPVTPESIDRLVAEESVVVPNPSILLKLDLSGFDAVRFFCKVALAAGFYIAGEPFGRSVVAGRLRTTVRSKNIEELPLPGVFWPFVKPNDAFKFFSIPDSHVLAFLPYEQNILAISLFDGSYTALVPLHDEGEQPWLSHGQGRVFQLLLKEKRLKQWSFDEYLLARPWIPSSESQ